MDNMSHGGEIFGLGGDAATEPSFETALRGYEKKQVERYVARAENEIAALATEREQAYSQIQAMAAQIERLQQEATQARRQPGLGKDVSFRHLGPRVEQILTLAEEQADDIRAKARDTAIAAVSPSPLR
jgi:cell division septum initiation protein DivIVA